MRRQIDLIYKKLKYIEDGVEKENPFVQGSTEGNWRDKDEN